ncbi:hypothetical protein [Streptomyces sp. NPDC051000]|uniref:hypothetical protein n=1 Tax=Streptomyces sp. NPDC051000 TaxID=3155520 RepID=UPI0033EF29F7
MTDLHESLRQAARAHEPDRERMLARVERGMAGAPRTAARRQALSWPRVTLAALTAGAALVVGVHTAVSVVGEAERGARQVVTAPDVTGPPSTPSAAGTESGPLWSDGSVDPHGNAYWAQSNITLQTREPLTAFSLEVRIAQTGGVASTGTWQTLPGADFDVAARRSEGALVYRWTLKAGRTVPAGRHVFATQYDHAQGGRDAAKDAYAATGTTAGGTAHAVGGGF